MFKKLLLLAAFFCLFMGGFAQTINSLTPSSALQGQYLNVTIVGQGTSFTSGVSSVKLIYGAGSGTYYTAASVTIVSDTEVAADFTFDANAPVGFYRIEMYNNSNLISTLNAFEITSNSASISSVSPNSSQRNNTLTVSIVGVNTSFQSGGVSTVKLLYENGSPTTYFGSNIQVISETQASASFTFPNDAPLGSYYLEMYTNSQILIESSTFTVVDPNAKEISSISPSSSGRNQSLTVSLVGLNTSFQSGGVSSVKLHLTAGSQTFEYFGTNILVTDDTHFSSNFTIPFDAPINYYDVVVTSNNEELVKSNCFNVTAQNDASISSVSPNTSELNKTLTVTVVGLNTSFQSDGVSSVQLIYGAGSSTTYMGSLITINSETELTVDFNIPANAPLGYYSMELVSNNKTLKKYNAFEVYNPNPAYINSVSPASSERNKILDVTVVGINSSFQSGISSFKIVYSGGSPTTYIGSNILVTSNTSATASFSIPANAPLGYYTVEINNNGTILTKNSSFLVTAPVQSIQSVSKTTAAKEEAFVLTVIGKNTVFTSGVNTIEYSMENAYLLNNPTVFSGTNITVLNDTSLTVEFTVPADAFLGDYKLTLAGNTNLTKNNALQIESPGNDVSGTFDDLVEGDIIYLIDINTNDTVATDTLNANLYFEFMQVANGQYRIKVLGVANGSIPLTVSNGDNNTLALTSNGGSVLDYITGVKKVEERTSFLVYPNPAVSVLNIEVPSLNGNVEIFNSIGERLMIVSLNSMVENKITINVSELNSGMYFVNYINGMNPITATFLVVR